MGLAVVVCQGSPGVPGGLSSPWLGSESRCQGEGNQQVRPSDAGPPVCVALLARQGERLQASPQRTAGYARRRATVKRQSPQANAAARGNAAEIRLASVLGSTERRSEGCEEGSHSVAT